MARLRRIENFYLKTVNKIIERVFVCLFIWTFHKESIELFEFVPLNVLFGLRNIKKSIASQAQDLKKEINS